MKRHLNSASHFFLLHFPMSKLLCWWPHAALFIRLRFPLLIGYAGVLLVAGVVLQVGLGDWAACLEQR